MKQFAGDKSSYTIYDDYWLAVNTYIAGHLIKILPLHLLHDGLTDSQNELGS